VLPDQIVADGDFLAEAQVGVDQRLVVEATDHDAQSKSSACVWKQAAAVRVAGGRRVEGSGAKGRG